MAITNHDRVGKSLDLLKDGLRPFVERELKARDAQGWLNIVRESVSESQARLFTNASDPPWDATSLLAVMWNQWNEVFRKTLGHAERSLVSELRDHRNKWAHQQTFSSDDAYRALDSSARLLTAVSAPQALRRRGSIIATAQIYRRVWQLYVAHIFLFVIFAALVFYATLNVQHQNYNEDLGVATSSGAASDGLRSNLSFDVAFRLAAAQLS